jgi:ribosomal protein L37AE/L43A
MQRTMHNRVTRLESVLHHVPACARCGSPGRVPRRIINAPHDGPLPTCDGCGRNVDWTGWPVAIPVVKVMRGQRGTQWKGHA